MKRILITGGPTNEPIDEVMKITNMSTGSLSVHLGKAFHQGGYHVTLVLNHSVTLHSLPKDERMEIVQVETTEEMLSAIEVLSKNNHYDALIHAAAVGDYAAQFTFLMEDLAEELFAQKEKFSSPADILSILEDPRCKLDDSSKISSYQKNLSVKLTLTPKIIARLREWFPDTLICGCKLLENVSQEELFTVAQNLCLKNHTDYIFANDLAELRKGKTARYPVSSKGYMGQPLDTPQDIYAFVHSKL
ncbi:MAG: phosphopantothenoylcysteine decarboxylase [Anaerovoracaceae bacterium]